MTPKTQSVCKQFYPHPADSHICSVCNRWDWEHEPVAEPASTGEPSPPSAKEFWTEYYKSDPNFPPSEAACDFAEAYAAKKFPAPASTARTDGQKYKHKANCLWATPLPTGAGFWGCDCGLDKLLLDLEDYEVAAPKQRTPNEVRLTKAPQ